MTKNFFLYRTPWDITIERNKILTFFLQSWCGALALTYFVLVSESLFSAMLRYFSTFIDDVKDIINEFEHHNFQKLKNDFIDVINLHWKSIE